MDTTAAGGGGGGGGGGRGGADGIEANANFVADGKGTGVD